jgi:aspergillopepsin I
LNGYTWQISYGDGSGASGIVFADKVVVGPVTVSHLVLFWVISVLIT